ncbi:MAG: hypothetical protein KGO81_09850 [Bacteroidota bacterium]|nr:hypothetical protein [Bacteroidota bacterium]
MIDFLLRDIQLAHKRRDLSKLEILIHELLTISPIPVVEISENVSLERLRNNYKGEIFHSEADISFRQDYWNIKEFGRANFPSSSKFYCSLASKYVKDIRIVNVLETNKEFRQKQVIKKRQVFTSGQWITNSILKVAVFPFNQSAILYNEEIGFHSNKFYQIINNFSEEQRMIYKKTLRFISYFYSLKEIMNHYDYTVSAYLSEFIFDKYNLDGILYPTVRAQFRTYNLVLRPEVSLSKLTFTKAAMFELILIGKKAVIDNIADGEKDNLNNIYWNYTERTSEGVVSKLL